MKNPASGGIFFGQIRSGAALERLRQMVEWQGGDASVIEDPSRLPRAETIVPLLSPGDGYVRRIDFRKNFGQVRFSPRPTRSDLIRKLTWQARNF